MLICIWNSVYMLIQMDPPYIVKCIGWIDNLHNHIIFDHAQFLEYQKMLK